MNFLISTDLYVEKMRYKAVNCMCRSYRPHLPVSYISQVLGFSTGVATNGVSNERETDASEECSEWLKAHGASIVTDNNGDMLLDTKVCLISILYIHCPVVANLVESFCYVYLLNHHSSRGHLRLCCLESLHLLCHFLELAWTFCSMNCLTRINLEIPSHYSTLRSVWLT